MLGNVNISICYLIFGLIQICGGLHLRAYVDQKGIRGYVQFAQSNLTSKLQISFRFRPNLRTFNNIQFAVTKGPSIYDDWCNNTGGILYNFSASLGYITYNSNFTDNIVKIMGKDSVLGNSLVLYENDTIIACSTILPHGDVYYAAANIFSSKVGGAFHFIQSKQGGGTFIYGNLQDDGDQQSTRSYDVIVSADTAEHATCEPLHQVYNPEEKSGLCNEIQQNTCKIGALSEKHGQLLIGRGSTATFTGVDINLPLTGDHSLLSRYLVIKTSGDLIVGCAKINIAGPLEVIATFNAREHKGISGYLKFSQQSPYHFTKFVTKLNGLDSRVSGYHVHRFPISDPKNPCSGRSVGGHVNTWNVDISKSPDPFSGSLDKYEVGDLSGRYGGLKNKNDYEYTTTDANLPLYGLYTILGRSIVIHRNNGARFVCTDIEPENYKLKMSSTSNFTSVKDSTVTGTVHSMQYIQRNGIVTRTISVVDIKHKDGTTTNEHKWSIQQKPVAGNNCPSKSSSNNPVYNPVNVPSNRFCSEKNPFLCPIGDLSGKVGTYDMKHGKSFFSDENLPMFGKMTSLGRSILFFHQNGSDTSLACANIVPDAGRAVSKLTFNVIDKTLKDDVAQLRGMLRKAFEFPVSQEFRINSLTTSLLENDDNCFKVEFYMIDTNKPPNAATYKCALEEILNSTEKMSPYKWCSSAFIFTPSMIVIALSVISTFMI